MTSADPELVEAARTGNTVAVERLLVVCQPDLRRFARRVCATGGDAEDAVQIALRQLYRKIGALRAVASLVAGLFKIIERECYRLLRGHRQRETSDHLLTHGYFAAGVPTTGG
jgi:DNA-directed RNA polymerase specialized sigma24 family protein